MKQPLTKKNLQKLVDRFLSAQTPQTSTMERMTKIAQAASKEGKTIQREKELLGR